MESRLSTRKTTMLFTKAQDEREDDAAKKEANLIFEELIRHIFERNKEE